VRLAPLVALGLAALVATPAASAQTPDQVYSPSSPAGAEYQVPLAHAHSEAAGLPSGSKAAPAGRASTSGSHSTTQAPLFGVGVTRGTTGKRTGRSGNPPSPSGQKPAEAAATAAAARVPPAASVPADGLQALSAGGTLILVLLAGGGIGLLLARKRRSRA
jgi:hypothetical protein